MENLEGQPPTLVDIKLIHRPNVPVRETFDEEEIAALAKSIRENGILVPLLVRQRDDGFEVIDGDQRLAACWRERIGEVPVVVRNANDSEVHVLRMLANLDRTNPNVVSEAKYIAKACEESGYTIDEFAKLLHRSPNWVQDRLDIADMPDYMQDALSQKQVSLGVALELNKVNAENLKRSYLTSAIEEGMTVATAQYAVREANKQLRRAAAAGKPEAEAVPFTPPKEPEAVCERCQSQRPLSQMRLARLCNPNCEKLMEG